SCWAALAREVDFQASTSNTSEPLGEALGIANSATLGAVHVKGQYHPTYYGQATRTGADIEVARGNFGAYEILDISGGTFTRVYGDGNLVSYRANEISNLDFTYAQNFLWVDNNVGLVRSTGSFTIAEVIAGAGFGQINTNAFIQNLRSADYYDSLPFVADYGLSATGGIGSVEIDGNMNSAGFVASFLINSDNIGTETVYLDLLNVGGNWASGATLQHGPNADIRMVNVEGDIYTTIGLYSIIMEPTQFDNGTTSVIEDDGGGQLIMTPGIQWDPVTVQPVTFTDAFGRITTALTDYSYWVIPVTGKTGGVLARLESTGGMNLTVPNPGDVLDIGHVNIGAGAYNGWDNFTPQGNPNYSLVLTYAENFSDGSAFAYSGTLGNEPNQAGTFSTRYVQTLVYSRTLESISDRLDYVAQTDFGFQNNALAAGGDAYWYGLNQYLFYKVSDCMAYGIRAEWFRDQEGFRVGGFQEPRGLPNIRSGYPGSFYEVTAGANYRYSANTVIRPYVRFDWFSGTALNGAGTLPFDNGTGNSQTLLGLDVITLY
ncbi:hypothetical protein LCGC14_2242260, partial [marine sediment metagenome]